MVSSGIVQKVLCWINTDEPPGAAPALKALDRLVYWRQQQQLMLARSSEGAAERVLHLASATLASRVDRELVFVDSFIFGVPWIIRW